MRHTGLRLKRHNLSVSVDGALAQFFECDTPEYSQIDALRTEINDPYKKAYEYTRDGNTVSSIYGSSIKLSVKTICILFNKPTHLQLIEKHRYSFAGHDTYNEHNRHYDLEHTLEQVIAQDDLTAFKLLASITHMRELLANRNYKAYKSAATYGSMKILKALHIWSDWKEFPNLKQKPSYEFGVLGVCGSAELSQTIFYQAVNHNHHAVAKKILDWATPELQQQFLLRGFEAAFRLACVDKEADYHRSSLADMDMLHMLYSYANPTTQQALLKQLTHTPSLGDATDQCTVGSFFGSTLDNLIRQNKMDVIQQIYFWLKEYDMQAQLLANVKIYYYAILHKQLKIFEWLMLRSTSAQRKAVLEHDNYSLFTKAFELALESSSGDNSRVILKRILTAATPTQRHAMLSRNHYEVFRLTIVSEDKALLKLLCTALTDGTRTEIVSLQCDRTLHDEHNNLFLLAAAHGQVRFLRQLYSWANPTGKLKLLMGILRHMTELSHMAPYTAFTLAVKNNHVAAAEFLLKQGTEVQRNTMIQSNISSRRSALTYDHSRPERYEAIHQYPAYYAGRPPSDVTHTYSAFLSAVRTGNLETVTALYSWASPIQRHEMLTTACERSYSREFAAFYWAIKEGHLGILQQLHEWASPQMRQDLFMLGYTGRDGFSMAVKIKNNSICRQLFEWAPEQQKITLLAEKTHHRSDGTEWVENPISEIIYEDNIELLQQVHQWFNDETFDQLVARNNYSCLTYLAKGVNTLFSIDKGKANREITHFILNQSPKAFAYADKANPTIRDKIVPRFIAHKVYEWQAKGGTPTESLVLDEQQATLGYYLLRALIRNCSPDDLDMIKYLIDVPVIREKLHLAVGDHEGDGEPNELLLLAMSLKNEAAVDALLEAPKVHDLAEANNYYVRQTTEGGLNLADRARNRESSMEELKQEQKKILQIAIDKYDGTLKSFGGVDCVFEDLHARLKQRFKANPAQLTINGVTHNLPFEWSKFQTFITDHNLNKAQVKQAKIAYYKHPDHTAAHYLTIPNPRISKKASFVYINEAHTERWAIFERYKTIIAYLYLAVIDHEVLPVNGHTFESRLTYFINELAGLGRAHNWDNRRLAKNNDGTQRYDKEGKKVYEYYDDLKADKPSCVGGVLLRLFESVVGHRLFNKLTGSVLNQEIRDFIRQQLAKQLNESTFQQLDQLLTEINIMIAGDGVHGSLLDWNVSEEVLEQFKQDMADKWQEDYTDNAGFVRSVKHRFRAKPDKESFITKHYHFADLDGLVRGAHRKKEQHFSYALDARLFKTARAAAAVAPHTIHPMPAIIGF